MYDRKLRAAAQVMCKVFTLFSSIGMVAFAISPILKPKVQGWSSESRFVFQISTAAITQLASARVTPPFCLAVCSTPPTNPANGTFNCATNSTANTVCRAVCKDGYIGSPTTTCQTTGAWTTTSGTCQPGKHNMKFPEPDLPALGCQTQAVVVLARGQLR